MPPPRRLVARRRHLPGLSPLLRRHRRRRHGRPARHHRPPAATCATSASTRCGCRRSTRRRRPTPATTWPTTAPSTRSSATSADADKLIAEAHALRPEGASSTWCPNHTSDEHAWFQAALAAGAGQPGARPLHLPRRPRRRRRRAAEQLAERLRRPGLDRGHRAGRHARPVVPAPVRRHASPTSTGTTREVRAEFVDILRFWLDRGVDGFRVDVAHGLVKEADLADWHAAPARSWAASAPAGPPPPMWDQDGVHEIYRQWRAVLDEYPGEPDPGRRGLGAAGRAAGPLRAPGRDAPGVQLRVPGGALDAPTPQRTVIDALAGRQRRGRRADHLGAVQPRRGAARVPARAARSASRGRTASASDDPQPDAALACAGPGRPRC